MGQPFDCVIGAKPISERLNFQVDRMGVTEYYEQHLAKHLSKDDATILDLNIQRILRYVFNYI